MDDVRKQFIKGNYAECVRQAEAAILQNTGDEEWPLLLAQSLLTVGKYTNAQAAVTTALKRHPQSIRLRLLGYHVFLQGGKPDRAKALLEEINNLGGSRTWAYRDAPNLIALGKAALLLGADPRDVLEKVFDQAKKADPTLREAYLASGELGLDKHDDKVASAAFLEGLKRFPDDPDMLFGLARAYASSDRARMMKSLDAALDQNTNHVPSMLLLVDHLIDSEQYKDANELLEKVLAVNPAHPEAWAYRAVIAHLRADNDGEKKSRETALKNWPTNPAVDQLIGKKLAQKYRFAEGAEHQRQALQFDSTYLPAKSELAQALLRLGDETEGWRLVDEVYKIDGYDAVAFNLVGLHETMSKFRTLTNQDFAIRMDPHEAAIYGQRALELLARAKATLCAKYGMTPSQPTIVEIFTQQKDFGVRTFGMPENPGFLGVCFGSVITANSPASQVGHPANWEAVLWHEFCHVVTLQMTHNKMPRWLSEGISVYEERQANPVWGQAMTPRYREMILGKDLTPVGELSAAFLTAKSDLHIQFAYYESSLVVEFLVERFGLDSLKKILRDLGSGTEINQAIARHTAPLEKIEKDFVAFARDRAEKLAPGLDWEKPQTTNSQRMIPRSYQVADSGATKTNVTVRPPPPTVVVRTNALDLLNRYGVGSGSNADHLTDWIAKHPTNFYALTEQGKLLMEQKKYEEAKAPLKKLLELYPAYAGADNAYELLAEVHHALNETNQEREVLAKLATLDADAVDVFTRLMEMGTAVKDWPAVAQNAERFLAVNPLVAQPHRHLARASEELSKAAPAIQSYQTLLLLDPPNPADVQFRLARLLHHSGDPSAKRHVLEALEEAPRFRDAHKLLLEINAKAASTKSEAPAAKPESRP